MRVGFYINPQTPGPDDDGRIIDEVLGQVDLAEQIGYEDVWVTEHHFTGYNAYSDPVMLATAISQRNRRLRIGFSLAVAPLNHPLRFVTQCNILDRLSGGRLVVGIGPGNAPFEFEGYGYDAAERHEMLEEFLAITDKAWDPTLDGFSYDGKYWKGNVRGRIIPSPVQKPRPHMAWGTTTMDTVERIGRKGWSLLIGPQAPEVVAPRLKRYQHGMDAAGLDEATQARAWLNTGELHQVYCAAPGEDWRDTINEYIEIYIRKSALANTGIDQLDKNDIEKRKEGYLKNWLIAGTADELLERFVPVAKLGVAHLMCWHTFGHMPDSMVRASMMRFAADVIPVLNATKPDPAYLNAMATASDGSPSWRPR